MSQSKNAVTDGKAQAADSNLLGHSANIVNREDVSVRDVKQCVVNLLQLCFRKNPDESQQFLDIGCGSGEFTRNELLPRCLPCRRIVAGDLSQAHLERARKHSSHPKIEYVFLDIRKDVSDFVSEYGEFDRVYAFSCLHWTNLEISFKNIEKLLIPGGECIFQFPSYTTPFEWWRTMVQRKRWNKYAEIVEAMLPSLPPAGDEDLFLSRILEMLEAAKLKVHSCEFVSGTRTAVLNVDSLSRTVLAPNPLAPFLSQEENEAFEQEMTELIRSNVTAHESPEPKKIVTGILFAHVSKRRA